MAILDTIFGFYDKIIANMPEKAQFFFALVVLILIISSFIMVIKKGHWIFIILFAIFFPGGWTALRVIGTVIWAVIKFLLVRIQIVIQ